MNDEEVPYRTAFDIQTPTPAAKFTRDEADQSTLIRVLQILREGVADLDKWHAFDLTESELKLKQQIKAHQIAMSILAPTVEAVEQALAMVDEAFKQRNNK